MRIALCDKNSVTCDSSFLDFVTSGFVLSCDSVTKKRNDFRISAKFSILAFLYAIFSASMFLAFKLSHCHKTVGPIDIIIDSIGFCDKVVTKPVTL